MKKAIISFIGTDGAGKSTLIAELKKELESQQHSVSTVYFGWKPFLPTTKLLSFILKKRDYQIAEKMNSKNGKTIKAEEKQFSLFQEIMLSYYYIEYLSRYIFQLRLSSSKSIILVDRYFYDIYAHYHYANKSRIFPTLLKIMPKPNLTLFLDVDIETAKRRKPEMDSNLLKEHHGRYQKLSKFIDLKTIKTDQELEHSITEILNIIQEKIKP